MDGNPLERASDLYQQGRVLMDADRLTEAASLFQQSAEILPHFKTLELLGECKIRIGQPTEAIVPLAAAAFLNKGVRAPALLAEVFFALGERQHAEETVAAALSRDPNNRKALRVKDAISRLAS